jgi:hypothetical protein
MTQLLRVTVNSRSVADADHSIVSSRTRVTGFVSRWLNEKGRRPEENACLEFAFNARMVRPTNQLTASPFHSQHRSAEQTNKPER